MPRRGRLARSQDQTGRSLHPQAWQNRAAQHPPASTCAAQSHTSEVGIRSLRSDPCACPTRLARTPQSALHRAGVSRRNRRLGQCPCRQSPRPPDQRQQQRHRERGGRRGRHDPAGSGNGRVSRSGAFIVQSMRAARSGAVIQSAARCGQPSGPGACWKGCPFNRDGGQGSLSPVARPRRRPAVPTGCLLTRPPAQRWPATPRWVSF